MSVGMPFTLLLNMFGERIHHAFGHVAYHVGSSAGPDKSGWRDVDVRLILPDEEYEARGFGKADLYPQSTHTNECWVSTVLAWSCFGKHMTGLPIDFQIQPSSWANANESKKDGKYRSALLDDGRAESNSKLWDAAVSAERERAASGETETA